MTISGVSFGTLKLHRSLETVYGQDSVATSFQNQLGAFRPQLEDVHRLGWNILIRKATPRDVAQFNRQTASALPVDDPVSRIAVIIEGKHGRHLQKAVMQGFPPATLLTHGLLMAMTQMRQALTDENGPATRPRPLPAEDVVQWVG